MSLQSESTLAELQRASLRRDDVLRRYRHPGDPFDVDEDDEADAVTRTAAPITAGVLTMIAAAVVGIGVWSWVGSG